MEVDRESCSPWISLYSHLFSTVLILPLLWQAKSVFPDPTQKKRKKKKKDWSGNLQRHVRIRPRRFNGGNETFRLLSSIRKWETHGSLKENGQRREGEGIRNLHYKGKLFLERVMVQKLHTGSRLCVGSFERRQRLLTRIKRQKTKERERERSWAIGSSFKKPVQLVNAVYSGKPVNKWLCVFQLVRDGELSCCVAWTLVAWPEGLLYLYPGTWCPIVFNIRFTYLFAWDPCSG